MYNIKDIEDTEDESEDESNDVDSEGLSGYESED